MSCWVQSLVTYIRPLRILRPCLLWAIQCYYYSTQPRSLPLISFLGCTLLCWFIMAIHQVENVENVAYFHSSAALVLSMLQIPWCFWQIWLISFRKSSQNSSVSLRFNFRRAPLHFRVLGSEPIASHSLDCIPGLPACSWPSGVQGRSEGRRRETVNHPVAPLPPSLGPPTLAPYCIFTSIASFLLFYRETRGSPLGEYFTVLNPLFASR